VVPIALTVNGPITRVATLDEAKALFLKSWDAWSAWAKLEECVGLRTDKGICHVTRVCC
jgi:hypothetical protein